MVAFVSDVYPDCADEACNRQRREAAEKDPVKVHVLTRLLYRHWDEWREDVRHHVFVADRRERRHARPHARRLRLAAAQHEDGAIAFSPDSKRLAFVSNREGNDNEAWTTNNDVWLVPVGRRRREKLTANPAADEQPAFTPDGKSIIVRAQRRPGFESDRWYLDVYDRATGAKRTVFETPDLSVERLHALPRRRTIFFTATSKGTDNLYRVPLAGGTPELVAKGGAIGVADRRRRRRSSSRSRR